MSENVDRIPVCRPYLWGKEIEYVQRALERCEISSAGEFVPRFEEEFAAYCGARFGVACMNGTAACHLAFAAAGIGAGDEVICPTFTMMSPIFALLYLGAVPRFVDADATWTMDPAQVEAAVTERTRAILAVHIYGHPCDMDALRRIADRRGLLLLEDAAEAHGAEVRGRRIGDHALVSAFSFYANKIVTTGEGGVVVTSDQAVADRLRALRNLCFGSTPETRFIHTGIGFQYRMTNLQAALGVAQVEHIDEAVAAKVQIADRYDRLLAEVVGIERPPRSDWARNVFWVYGVLVAEARFGMSRLELQRRLAELGVETRTFFYPAHRQPMFAADRHPATPVADRLWDAGLYLPSYIGMGDATIDRVVTAIREIRDRASR